MTSSHDTPYAAMPHTLRAEIQLTGLDGERLHALVADALAEDLPSGADDVTSVATIPDEQDAVADLAARQAGVVAGTTVAELVFRYVMGDEVSVQRLVNDGQRVEPGESVMRVAGPTRGLLTAERTALNLLCHLSGVASATARWVEALEGSPTRVLDTRKTLPGLRMLQKYAVRCGGGVNHRLSLSDMAMVKDNHVIAAGGVVEALAAIRGRFPDVPVEVEVTTLDQLRELLALDAMPERVLLDNMDDATMTEAVRLTAGRVELEASGGITLERAARIGATGVDFVSVGALTHSVTVFDIGMDLVES